MSTCAAVAILVAVLASACASDAGPVGTGGPGVTTAPAQSTGTGTAADAVSLTQECANDDDGYVVRYPQGWHTNTGKRVPQCSYFHPHGFDLPKATEVSGIAISVQRQPVPFDRITGSNAAEQVEEREQLQIAGRRAVRELRVSTGEALTPADTRRYQYVVDLGDESSLVLSTIDEDSLDFAANRAVLDAMAESVELPR